MEGIEHHSAFMALLDMEDRGIIRDISVNNDEVRYFHTIKNDWVVIPIVWDDVQRGMMKDKTFNYLSGLYGDKKNRHFLFWFTLVIFIFGVLGIVLLNGIVSVLCIWLLIPWVLNRLCMLSYDMEVQERDCR